MLGPKNSRITADRQAQRRATNEDDFKLKEINQNKSDFRGDLCVNQRCYIGSLETLAKFLWNFCTD